MWGYSEKGHLTLWLRKVVSDKASVKERDLSRFKAVFQNRTLQILLFITNYGRLFNIHPIFPLWAIHKN